MKQQSMNHKTTFVIVQLGTLSECLISTSVINGIHKISSSADIIWVHNNDNIGELLRHSRSCRCIPWTEYKKMNDHFDILINMSPQFDPKDHTNIKYGNAIGFNCLDSFDEYVDIIYGNSTTNMNMFQIYFKLAKMTWHGEGYCFNYYPRTKTKKNRIGLALANANLRNYVSENLNLPTGKLWHVPYKKNILKKMDEINRCSKIVTDDESTLHLAAYLRKYVYFLEAIPSNVRIEFFGSGQTFPVPKSFIR